MSRQSDAKDEQGYIEKPIPKVCANCRNYRSVVETHKGIFGGEWKSEKNRRCAIGGFCVKKMATCDFFAFGTGE